MASVNENYLKLPGSYLFAEIARRRDKFRKEHPDADIIRLGIGDVTKPLPGEVIGGLHAAVDEMADEKTFKGYGPDGYGYDFLIKKIIKNDYLPRGVRLDEDEIFISDGAKGDTANIQEIFGLNNVVALTDPVYPVYLDSNVMSGRTGGYNAESGRFDGWSTCHARRRTISCPNRRKASRYYISLLPEQSYGNDHFKGGPEKMG